jgi:hypothetical protein
MMPLVEAEPNSNGTVPPKSRDIDASRVRYHLDSECSDFFEPAFPF